MHYPNRHLNSTAQLQCPRPDYWDLRPIKVRRLHCFDSTPPTPLVMEATKAIVKSTDTSEKIQQRAIECAEEALDQYNIEKELAAHI